MCALFTDAYCGLLQVVASSGNFTASHRNAVRKFCVFVRRIPDCGFGS